ncbi:MAG TPA: signal peptide peptidase SppA [Verrucomicrobiales bacterium]|nr:signal peptide peptidase SppA [Verrucomicrobiales bacterium]
MSRKTLGVICAILFVLLAMSVLMNVAVGIVMMLSLALAGSPGPAPPPSYQEQIVERGGRDRIAQIDLEGLISSVGGPFTGSTVEDVKGMLEYAAQDHRVKAVVLRINSPGGEVTASDTIYHAVGQLAALKPVIVYMDTVAASGGYYVACGGTHLMASETSITGSIGVIIQTLNYRELLGKVGLESVAFTSGRYKDTLSPSREMREDEKKMVQGMVDAMYARFLAIVSASRGIGEDELREGIADGRIMTGEEAQALGLIDETGYIEDAYTRARALGAAAGATVVRYRRSISLASLFGLTARKAELKPGQRLELDLSDRLASPMEPGQAYFLPAFYAR